MPTLDRLNNSLEVDDEIIIRARILEIFDGGETKILRVEWLTGPTPFLDFVRAETVEKTEPSEE